MGVETLHLGTVEDALAPERSFRAGEHHAVIPISSLTSHEAFDSGGAVGPVPVSRLLDQAARRAQTV
ncbi:hypothetical protein ACFQ08_34660, partial [Streptosporangium algeriense]